MPIRLANERKYVLFTIWFKQNYVLYRFLQACASLPAAPSVSPVKGIIAFLIIFSSKIAYVLIFTCVCEAFKAIWGAFRAKMFPNALISYPLPFKSTTFYCGAPSLENLVAQGPRHKDLPPFPRDKVGTRFWGAY